MKEQRERERQFQSLVDKVTGFILTPLFVKVGERVVLLVHNITTLYGTQVMNIIIDYYFNNLSIVL